MSRWMWKRSRSSQPRWYCKSRLRCRMWMWCAWLLAMANFNWNMRGRLIQNIPCWMNDQAQAAEAGQQGIAEYIADAKNVVRNFNTLKIKYAYVCKENMDRRNFIKMTLIGVGTAIFGGAIYQIVRELTTEEGEG